MNKDRSLAENATSAPKKDPLVALDEAGFTRLPFAEDLPTWVARVPGSDDVVMVMYDADNTESLVFDKDLFMALRHSTRNNGSCTVAVHHDVGAVIEVARELAKLPDLKQCDEIDYKSIDDIREAVEVAKEAEATIAADATNSSLDSGPS